MASTQTQRELCLWQKQVVVQLQEPLEQVVQLQ